MFVCTCLQDGPSVTQFLPDAMFAIFVMLVLCTLVYSYTAYVMRYKLGLSYQKIVVEYFDSLTIAVPPGLVACLSVATASAVVRLSKRNISITDTNKLNSVGYISYACFDKTGTLTDEKILFQGLELFDGGEKAIFTAEEIMATCHSLSISDIKDGKIVLISHGILHVTYALF